MSAAPQLLVTLTTDDLAKLLEQCTARALEKIMASQQQEVIDLAECSALLKRTPQTVMDVLVKRKALPCHFISAREPRFKRSEVLAWLDTLPTRAKASNEG